MASSVKDQSCSHSKSELKFQVLYGVFLHEIIFFPMERLRAPKLGFSLVIGIEGSRVASALQQSLFSIAQEQGLDSGRERLDGIHIKPF
jgi:hypothetical protein